MQQPPDLFAHDVVAGIDEAGRGCLAGPVVAAAVILPSQYHLPGLTDSKKLTSAKRNILAQTIKAQALSWALGFSWPREIERINILQGTLVAMSRALTALSLEPGQVLVDGNRAFPCHLPLRTVIGGDALFPCISAASIVAKTFRDKLMSGLDHRYPGYGLAQHKGYGTKIHMDALRCLGPSSIHRQTFRGVCREVVEHQPCLPNI